MSTLEHEKGNDIKTISLQTETWVRLDGFGSELVRLCQAPVTRTEQIEVLLLAYSRLQDAVRTLEEWKCEDGEIGGVGTRKNINDLLRRIKDEGVRE